MATLLDIGVSVSINKVGALAFLLALALLRLHSINGRLYFPQVVHQWGAEQPQGFPQLRGDVRQAQYEYPAESTVYLAALPMFHIYGLALFATGLLSMGTTVVVMQRFEPNRAIRAINRYKVMHFPVVPQILLAMVRATVKESQGSSLRSLKQVSSGATPMDNDCIKEFMRTFPYVDFIQGYGMTESAAGAIRRFNTETIWQYDSVGLLAPNMEAKVVDWRARSLPPPGKNRELLLGGPAIMKGTYPFVIFSVPLAEYNNFPLYRPFQVT